MDFNFEQPDLEHQVIEARTIEALEAALATFIDVGGTFNDPGIYGRKLFSPSLDALVPRVARKLRLEDVPRERSNDNVCIVATQFYGTGGHTRVAEDIIERLGPDRRPTIILTQLYEKHAYLALLGGARNGTRMGEGACLFLSAPSLADKILELYMMLAAIRPTRIILMSHPMDIVAVAAAWPFRSVVEFVHHADHVPALGVTLPFAGHADLTYTCHLACRQGGVDAMYVGMTAAAFEAPAPREPAPKRLRIATCGNLHKYSKKGRHGWTDYAVAALRQPGAELIHIGETDEAFQQGIRRALTAAGLDPQRYVFAGRTPNLPAELVRQEIDVYLSSYPVTGGKANLEAMMAGVPVIIPIDPEGPPLTRFRLPLPRWLEVRSPDQLRNTFVRARELGRTMNSPEQEKLVQRELGRFEDFVAGRQPEPAPAEDVLTV